MSSSRSSRSFAGRPVFAATSAAIAGDQRRLALLAAEAAAHAPHLDGDGVVGKAEHLGDGVLDLARMLRRGMDQHVARLAGDGVGDLTFEVEMVLAADDAACL